MKTYVIQRDGDEIGVFTKRQLKRGIQSGEFKASDEMRQSGTNEWHRLGSGSKLYDDLKDSTEDEGLPSLDSFVINPSSKDQTGFDMDAQNPDDTSVDVESDDPEGDSVDDSVDEDPRESGTEQARSDLQRATVFATQNFLRRSIFINQADSIQKYGHILQCIGVVVLGVYTYLVYRNPASADPLLAAGSWAAAIIVGNITAGRCRDAGQRLIASTPTSVRGNAPLDMLGLIILTAGIAVFVGSVLSAYLLSGGTEDKIWVVLYGALGLLASVLAAGLVLSPSITNVDVKYCSTSEEFFGLVALVAKSMLLLGPFVLACCSAIGVLQGGIALYHLWQTDGSVALTNMSGWVPALITLLIAGFYPLVMYFVLLVYSMFERMFR